MLANLADNNGRFLPCPVTTRGGNIHITHSTAAVLLTAPVNPVELTAEQAEDVAHELLAAAQALRAVKRG